jgi:hypothetical protein
VRKVVCFVDLLWQPICGQSFAHFRLLFVKKCDMMSGQQDDMDSLNLRLAATNLGMSGFDRWTD